MTDQEKRDLHRRIATVLVDQKTFLGWSNENVANEAGLATWTVQRMMSGEGCRVATLANVIGVLGLSLTDFFEMVEKETT